MRFAKITVALACLALTSNVQAGTGQPPPGVGRGMEPVAGVPWDDGMHLVVTRVRGRDYLFASSSYVSNPAGGAIRVFDVTAPARPKLVASIPCGGNQAFMQVSHDRKTLVVGEDGSHPADACLPLGQTGFYTIDISNPRRPKPVGYALVERGGHTVTTHPTKPLVYVSYGDLVPNPGDAAEFEVWSIAEPARPKHVATVPVSGFHGPHDMAFNRDGTRAVAASMSLIQVLDTSDPANPKELEVLQCPGCSHNHEAHFTPDQEHVIVNDESGGAAASPCPLGALYFYAWDPDASPHMELVGEWQPAELVTPEGGRTNPGLCTSHVFDVSRDGTKVAASWHTAGVRVVDITEPAGVGVGSEGDGAREIAWFTSEGADAWSARFDRTGRFVFVNDRHAGLQVYRLQPER